MNTKRIHWIFLLLAVFLAACENKDLAEECGCEGGSSGIKVVVNWEDSSLARAMRMNIFSQTAGVADYGRDNIPASGEKMITLAEWASYLPFCYDYYADGIYFRNETTLESFEAYVPEASRATYDTLATPVEGEATISDPGGDFYVHSWQETFDVIFCTDCEDSLLILNFYPENKLRRFTYRVNGIQGARYASDARGAISGMAASYFFKADSLSGKRSTVLFEGATIGTDYIEGSFCTFGPVAPYQNRFTVEMLSGSNYYTAYWNVSDQVTESMTDRPAKLARDGYDILIDNDPDLHIPEIPDSGSGGGDGGGNGNGNGNGSGFEIGVGDWDDVEIFL